MKRNSNGQAGILTPQQLKLLFAEGFRNNRDRALFGICFYTACRISEALQLQKADTTDKHILFRKATTKGKIVSRETRIIAPLAAILAEYQPRSGYLFPSCIEGCEFLNRGTAHRILEAACNRTGIVGVSTHSFRRTALTTMSNAGVPLRTIQKISGHKNLEQLARYLEVSDEQVYDAALTLNF